MRARLLARVATAAVVLAAAGCGAPTPPGEAAPGLRTQLSRVDSALAGGQYGSARTALDALVRETVAARDAGRISVDQADLVLAAAARLAADLPAQPSPRSTPTPTGRPDQKGKDEDKKKDGERKDEDGAGRNSGNGPDDGEGN